MSVDWCSLLLKTMSLRAFQCWRLCWMFLYLATVWYQASPSKDLLHPVAPPPYTRGHQHRVANMRKYQAASISRWESRISCLEDHATNKHSTQNCTCEKKSSEGVSNLLKLWTERQHIASPASLIIRHITSLVLFSFLLALLTTIIRMSSHMSSLKGSRRLNFFHTRTSFTTPRIGVPTDSSASRDF